MIVVDTSVWIDTIRKPGSRRAADFRQLIEADEVGWRCPFASS